MFTRKEYPARLKAIGLSTEQVKLLRDVLEEMMTLASRQANKVKYSSDSVGADRFVTFMEGKSIGINAVDRFLRGDMDAHDEFGKENDSD